jgi:Domain of unknown function (DUF4258)
MPRKILAKIREHVRLGQYDMTAHAMEEMAEDYLDIIDIESAVMTGSISRVETGDPRGKRYVIAGVAANNTTPVGVVGRFPIEARYLIITVYEITPRDD